MKIKIISTLVPLILLATNANAHSVSWSPGGVIFIYALAFLPPILISFGLAYFIPKLIKNNPSGLFKNIFVRAFFSYLALSFLLKIFFLSISSSSVVTQTELVASEPIRGVQLAAIKIPKKQSVKYLISKKTGKCSKMTSYEIPPDSIISDQVRCSIEGKVVPSRNNFQF